MHVIWVSTEPSKKWLQGAAGVPAIELGREVWPKTKLTEGGKGGGLQTRL